MPRLVHVVTVPITLRFLRGQVEFMNARGFDVHVVSSPGAMLDAFVQSRPVTGHSVTMTRAISPSADLRAVGELTALLRRLRPEIVHAHTPKGGLVGMLAATAARVPNRIYHLRGLPYLTATGMLRRALWTTESTSCGLAHRVYAVSRSLANAARDARFVGTREIRVIGAGSSNGVDAVRFDPQRVSRVEARRRFGLPPDAHITAFVGRLVCDKGIVELADAWRRVRGDGRHLFLVGPYEERDPVPDRVRAALRDDERVTHVSFTEDMPQVYAASDVLVLPTYREGFPNAPLEAAVMGLPVIASDAVGAVDSVVDGVTGTVVRTRDAGTLADAMERYAKDPSLGQGQGRAGRARALEVFAPETIWRGLADGYVEMLGG